MTIRLSLCLFLCLSVCVCLCLFDFLSVSSSLYFSLSLCVYLSVCPSISSNSTNNYKRVPKVQYSIACVQQNCITLQLSYLDTLLNIMTCTECDTICRTTVWSFS